VTFPPFRVRLKGMLDALRADTRVELLDVVVRPPADPEEIAEAEAVVGMSLPRDLRDFYAAHDGVFVLWGLRDRDYPECAGPFESPDYGQPPGCINLLPVREAMSPEWDLMSKVNEFDVADPEYQARWFGQPLVRQPLVSAVCVDNYAKFHHGDLILGPEPVMIAPSDHGADTDSSDFCSFSTYLDLTLAVFGACRHDYGLGILWTPDGHPIDPASRKGKRIDAWTRPANLDAIITDLLSQK
jgi:SMI1/KNR4 family protein SUKH-1